MVTTVSSRGRAFSLAILAMAVALAVTDAQAGRRRGNDYAFPGVASGYLRGLDADATSDLAAVISDGQGLTVVDLFARSAKSLALSGYPLAVVVYDEVAYLVVVNGALRFYTVDLRDPASPRFVGSPIDLGGWAGSGAGIAIDNGVAYVAGSTSGLLWLDISSPFAPRKVSGSLSLTGSARKIAVDGGLGVVSTSVGLHVLDLSHPLSPVLRGFLSAAVQDVGIQGVMATGVVGTSPVLFDLTNPSSPRYVKSLRLATNGVVWKAAGILTWPTYSTNLHDLSPALEAVLVRQVPIQEGAWTATLAGSRILVVDYESKLHVYY